MANMSYCRYENTSNDLYDCVEAIHDGKTTDLNSYEKNGLRRIIKMAHEIVEMDEDGHFEHLSE